MRIAEFQQLVADEFGPTQGAWVLHSHVLSSYGRTAEELIDAGEPLRKVWWGLCEDFDVPELRRLGRDE